MSEWTHPTMADAGYHAPVRCRCGRERLPSDMLDVRALGVGTDYLCASACVEDLLRRGQVDRLTLHRRVQAPDAWLEAYEAKLRTGPLLRSGLLPEIWGEILARDLDAKLPVEARWESLLAVELARLATLGQQDPIV